MNFDKWINAVGAIGLIGSLIFVGLELRQGQRIALAGQAQARAALASDHFLAPLEGQAELLEALEKIPSEMTPTEFRLMERLWAWRWMMLENNFYQYEVGLLPDVYWAQSSHRIVLSYSECEFRHMLGTSRIPTFIEYLNSLPDPCSD